MGMGASTNRRPLWTCLEFLSGIWTMPQVDQDLASLGLEEQSVGNAPESFL